MISFEKDSGHIMFTHKSLHCQQLQLSSSRMASSKPRIVSIILMILIAFKYLEYSFPVYASAVYGESSDMADYFDRWNAASFLWAAFPFFLFCTLNRGDEEKLRRILTFEMYNVCIWLGRLIQVAPQKSGGLEVDDEHQKDTIIYIAFLFLIGSALSSGASSVCTEQWFVMSSSVKVALVLHMAAFLYWTLDVVTLSPISKYATDFDSTDYFAIDASRWFAASPLFGGMWIMYALTYEDFAGMKALLTWEVIVHVVTECLIRFTSFGLYFPADAVLQGTIMRIVLGIVGSWALTHGEPNGYDEMV